MQAALHRLEESHRDMKYRSHGEQNGTGIASVAPQEMLPSVAEPLGEPMVNLHFDGTALGHIELGYCAQGGSGGRLWTTT